MTVLIQCHDPLRGLADTRGTDWLKKHVRRHSWFCMNTKCTRSVFERNNEHYKVQDKQPKENQKNTKKRICYCNAPWFLDNINAQCNYCGCGFHIHMQGGTVMNSLTCQRVSNLESYSLDNIAPRFCYWMQLEL